MTNPKGELILQAGGQEYRLHLGMSVIADVQAKHGQDFMTKLEPPEGATEDWLPDLAIVISMMTGALQRHHKDVADRFLVDDLLAENPGALANLLQAAFPEQEGAGNETGPKAAA